MLTAVSVRNFKVVRNSNLLPLQPLTAFIGRNGSGKSSILEALDWLSRALAEGPDAACEQYQALSDVIYGHIENGSFSISLEFDPEDASVGERVVYSVTIGNGSNGSPEIWDEALSVSIRSDNEVVIRSGAEEETHLEKAIGDNYARARFLQRVSISNAGRRSTEKRESIAITDAQRFGLSIVDPAQHRGGSLLLDFLERAVFLRLNPKVIASFSPAKAKRSKRLLDDEGLRLAELLGQFDDETIEILIEKLATIVGSASNLESHTPQSPADRRFFSLVERNVGGEEVRVPAWVMSEGTRRMTAILAVLLHPEPPTLLCIEEVENGLDPWTLQFLLNELAGAAQRGTQVLLTTHSPYLIDMLGAENIILCDRQDYGVEYYSADRLPDTRTLQLKLGLGKLYTNRYLYGDRAKE